MSHLSYLIDKQVLSDLMLGKKESGYVERVVREDILVNGEENYTAFL